MVWPLLTIALVLAIAGLQFWWRARFTACRLATERELDQLRSTHNTAIASLHSQQETVLNSMVEGLLLRDSSGRVQFANTAFLKLFQISGDPKGKSLIEAVRIHELTELASLIDNQDQLLGRELRLSRPQPRTLEVNGAPIFQDGRILGSVLVFHDLTRIKELEQTREEFVANVSHELRTPLSLIKGYAETLLDGAKDNPEVATKFLQSIDRNAERLRLIIEDLLTISQLESGRIRLNLTSVALRPLADKVLADLAARAQAKGTRLGNSLPDLVIQADPDRIYQVLCNLVDNAIKYGASKGSVEVRGRLNETGQSEISVADDGPGLPAEALDRVFERFYRLDKARSREQGGTGLGLSIVKHIIQSHGGRVWATSTPGQGAEFFFTLPSVPLK